MCFLKNKSIVASLVILIATFITDSLMAQDVDKLYPSNGAAVTGKITEMTRNNVVMEVRGVKENFQAIDIQRILYEGEPASYTKAKEAVLTEQWEDAMDSLKKVDFKSILRDDIKKEFEFYVGLVQAKMAMSGQGDPAAAEARLLNFVKANSNSFHFFNSSDALGSLAASTGGHDRALKYFAALASSPFPAQKLKAQYSLGNSNLAVGKVAEARAAFGEALAGATDDAVSKQYKKLASVGMIRCETADKKYTEAIEKLRKLVSDTDATDNELFAQIYNALGEAHLLAGQEEEAILAYLHTDLLFTSNPDSHAEALYHLIQLFTKVDPPRVAETKARLQSLYANSAWAKK